MKGQVCLQPIPGKAIHLEDKVGVLIGNITDRWLLSIRETNPAILDMFLDTERKPVRHMLPWSGEFAGKYLTNAVQICSMTHDKRLQEYLHEFVTGLLEGQKENGYLGPWPEAYQLTGRAPVMGYAFDRDFKPHDSQTWDAWAHYHIMYGLLRWYDLSGEERALEAVKKIGDLFCSLFFGESGRRLWDIGDQDMNLAPIHSFVLLYEKTGDEKYLRFAQEVEKDFEKPPAGDYIRCALAGQEFYQMPKPRWESLHAVQGIAELYLATGDERYKQAFEHIWWSIMKTDVHNTGGFSTTEQAVGNPWQYGPVETCCVIAHMATSVDMLRLTGDPAAADALEWATFNSSLGSFSPSGRWSTYNTPMEGYKRANYHEIGFQCRPGSPDLNCCSVNAPRAFGMLTDWGVMTDEAGSLYIQYYGEGRTRLELPEGEITVVQRTAYPYAGYIRVELQGLGGKKKAVKFRIPHWSKNTAVKVNGEAQATPQAGSYYTVERAWADGDAVELELDMSLRFSAGEKDYAGRSCVFCGPLLLCLDPFYDEAVDFDARPRFDAKTMKLLKVDTDSAAGGLFTCTAADGRPVVLCDMYSAGVSGNPYTSWLDIDHVKPAAFSRKNLTRSDRP